MIHIREIKRKIRQSILKQRDMIDKIDKQRWDNKIFNKVINNEYYKKANMIFIFVSFKSEVNTHKLIEYAIKDNKEICVPKIKTEERGIELYEITGFNDLEIEYYNVLEPIEGSKKIRSENRVKRIAIAYYFQLLNKVPMYDNDMRVNVIITNKKTYLI